MHPFIRHRKQHRQEPVLTKTKLALYTDRFETLNENAATPAERDTLLRAWRFLSGYAEWLDTVRSKQRKLYFYSGLVVSNVVLDLANVYTTGITPWRLCFACVTIALFYTVQSDRAELKAYKQQRPRYQEAFTTEEQVLGLLRDLRR